MCTEHRRKALGDLSGRHAPLHGSAKETDETRFLRGYLSWRYFNVRRPGYKENGDWGTFSFPMIPVMDMLSDRTRTTQEGWEVAITCIEHTQGDGKV